MGPHPESGFFGVAVPKIRCCFCRRGGDWRQSPEGLLSGARHAGGPGEALVVRSLRSYEHPGNNQQLEI